MTPVVVDEGDSISVFWGGNHTGIFAAAHPGLSFHGQAVGGSSISDTSGGNGLVQRRAADGALKPTHVTLLIGANDLAAAYAYPTTQDWLGALFAYVATWRSEGVKVAVSTVLPQCVGGLTSDNTTRHNQRRVEANLAIRAAVGKQIDAVIDYASDPVMGVDEAACDKTLYSDGLHPTDGATGGVGGQGKLAVIYTAAVESFLGL